MCPPCVCVCMGGGVCLRHFTTNRGTNAFQARMLLSSVCVCAFWLSVQTEHPLKHITGNKTVTKEKEDKAINYCHVLLCSHTSPPPDARGS